MSDVEWDAEEFVPSTAVQVTDKWAGEDEEPEVKDNWDEDEEELKKGNNSLLTTNTKKKKKLTEIVAEKEKKLQDDLERRQKEREEERNNLSPEAQIAEKLRIKKIQEDADLALASDILGVKETKESTTLDELDLSTKENLDEFRQTVIEKIRGTDRLERKPFFVSFVEDLSRELCNNMELDDIKRVTTVLNALYNEKVKANKPTKGKKKGAGKAKLNPGQGAIADVNNYDYNEYDDFI